jgi:hypothetical protein
MKVVERRRGQSREREMLELKRLQVQLSLGGMTGDVAWNIMIDLI